MRERIPRPAKKDASPAIAPPEPTGLFAPRPFPEPTALAAEPAAPVRPESVADLGKLIDIPLFPPEPATAELTEPVQAKLSGGKTGDRYEQAADRTAAEVMATPEETVQRKVMPEEGKVEEGKAKSLNSPSENRVLEQGPLGRLENLHAQTTTIDPGLPGPFGDDPCFALLEELIKLAAELRSREGDLLYDRHDLYNRRQLISDPPITTGTGDPGSYEGHQKFYEKLQEQLQEKIRNFQNNDDCDDNDPWMFGMERGWDLAQEYSVKPVPEEPLPKEPNRLLEIAEELGAFVENGVLWVDENVAPAVLTTLEVIALLLSIPIRFFTERTV